MWLTFTSRDVISIWTSHSVSIRKLDALYKSYAVAIRQQGGNMLSITNIGTPHIKPVCPEAYAITTPVQVLVANPQHKNLNDWRWVNLRPMSFICIHAHYMGAAAVGCPDHTVSFSDSIGLLKAFGPLMKGNLGKAETCYNYYVRNDRRQHGALNLIEPPTVEDFFIESTNLPSDEEVQKELVFVPSGWAIEMVSLLRRGVEYVTIDESQKVIVHTLDGASYYHRAAQ